MIQKVKNILILFTAVLVFFVGTGVTIIDLCCVNCVTNVINMKSRSSHCDIDADANTMSENHSCCSSSTSPEDVLPCTNQYDHDCCMAQRIDVDIEHKFFKPSISSPLLWCGISLCTDIFCLHSFSLSDNESDKNYRIPTPIPPRDYLSLIRILII